MTDKKKMPWSDPSWRDSKVLMRFREFVRGKTQRFSQVQRWNPSAKDTMTASPDGSYVQWTDYEKLLSELKSAHMKLARAGEHMKTAIQDED